MNLFDTLKQLLPRGGTITTPTVRADVAVDGAVLHVPAMLSVSVSWDVENLIVEPVGLELTRETAFWKFPVRARVKVSRLELQRDGDVFASWSYGILNRRIQLVDAGDA